MTFFFAWCEKDEAFDKMHHLRHDLTLLSFDISQSEGDLALLKIVSSNFQSPKSFYCFLSYQGQKDKNPVVLFSGQLSHFPMRESLNKWKLEFRAKIKAQDLKKLSDSYEGSHNDQVSSDDFCELMNDHTLTKMLHHRTGLHEFNRISGDVVFCDLFEGNSCFEPKIVFDKGIAVKFVELPYRGVELSLIADWKQKDAGEVNVAPLLAQHFSSRIINTFTPSDFQRTFPRIGTKLGEKRGKSSCRIVESSLVPITPHTTGVLDMYPTVSPVFIQKNIDEDTPRPVQFKRSWYKATLNIEWSYSQKRREIIKLNIRNGVQSPSFRSSKKLRLTFGNLENSSISSFFKTKKGEKAIEFALMYAQCFLSSSARCIEVEFYMPLEEGFDLSTDQNVDLTSILKKKSTQESKIFDADGINSCGSFDCDDDGSTLKNANSLYGKITHYRLSRKGLQGYAFVRCALSIGVKELNKKNNHANSYAEEGMFNHAILSSPIQSIIDEISRKIRPRGIVDTQCLHTDQIVEKITVYNDAVEQIDKLSLYQFPSLGALKDVLKKNPTRFSITLKDLGTEPLLEEIVEINDLAFAPKQNSKQSMTLEDVFYAI